MNVTPLPKRVPCPNCFVEMSPRRLDQHRHECPVRASKMKHPSASGVMNAENVRRNRDEL